MAKHILTEAQIAAKLRQPGQFTVDITPTWQGILPALLAAHENGTFEGRKIAAEELLRMAKIADAYVAEHKEDQ